MQSSNAILAINSLDRYIDKLGAQTLGYFTGQIFGAPGPQYILWDPLQPFTYEPVVGATVIGPNITAGARILNIVPDFQGFLWYLDLDLPITASSPAGTQINIVYQFTAGNQPTDNSLIQLYLDALPYANSFTIQSPGALLSGYINRIIVSQIQIQYNIPTVNLNLNDTFAIADYAKAQPPQRVVIPYGFYFADELAAMLQLTIRATTTFTDMVVIFVPRDGFVFTSATTDFYFPSPIELQARQPAWYSNYILPNILKVYRLLGITTQNSFINGIPERQQTSFDAPNFLYTPYIDIYSDILTNYQRVKDTNTSIAKPKGLIARIYVSGTGGVQVTGSTSALGTAPFVMTADLNSPKVIRWSPEAFIPSLDFQLLDCYGNLIPGEQYGYNTEFQITLLCIEDRDNA